jgi:catechol 2,3-dioxygenase-like lactoylglutathione lyase family enzyme
MLTNITSLTRSRICRCVLLLLPAALLWLALPTAAGAAEAKNEFSNSRIDIGIVVSEAARTAGFLTNAIGFTEVKGFSVTPELGRKVGLIDGHAVDVRVFVLGEGEQATRIKVLSFPAAKPQAPPHATIHSALGMRYVTLYVKDMNQALARLKAAQVPLLGESPVDVGGGNFLTAVKDPDGNFIELIGPMTR